MKKLLIISAGLLFIFSSCNSKKEGGMSDRAKKNLEASRVVAKAFETGDASGIDAVVADDFVDHTDRGDMGRDSLKAMITYWKKADPTMSMETLQEFANDDYTTTWYKFKGASDGTMGPKGSPYEMSAIEMVKFNKDSKATEHWGFMEMREVMKMMGKDGTTPPTDTTSHM